MANRKLRGDYRMVFPRAKALGARRPSHRSATPSWTSTICFVVTLWFIAAILVHKYVRFSRKDSTSYHASLFASRNSPLYTVCLVSNDFRGLPNAGGTATAFELLTRAMAEEHSLFRVVFVAAPAPDQFDYEKEAYEAHNWKADSGMSFHFLGEKWHRWDMTDTYQWESAGIALVEWLKNNTMGCDFVHVHEWGGLAAPAVVYNRFGGFRAGMPIIVQEHGGHRWSTQLVIPEENIVHLRIDGAEKTAIETADAITAPSSHMLNWYAQRGWQHPNLAQVIPNVLETSISEPFESVKKPVQKLVFFGRLQERKGLKLFIEALRGLSSDVIADIDFSVIFLGGEDVVDDLPSSKWINMRMQSLDLDYTIIGNAPQNEAMDIIREEGTLLVFCSTQENAPYAVMEASLEQVPFITYDVGGVRELLNLTDPDTMMPFQPLKTTINVAALQNTIERILQKGYHRTTPLRREVLHGKSIWKEWHLGPARELANRLREEQKEKERRRPKSCSDVHIYSVTRKMIAMDIFADICSHGDENDNILLMPRGMSFNQSSPQWQEECLKFELPFEDILVFGTYIRDTGRVSFATNPTWVLYQGVNEYGIWQDACSKQIPLFMKRRTLCASWKPNASNFVTYSSWSIILLLKRVGREVFTYPVPIYKLEKWQDSGSSCMQDRSPEVEILSYVPANMRSDPQYALLHTAGPTPQPLADLLHDLEQGAAKHWDFGYGQDLFSFASFQRYAEINRDMITLLGAAWTCEDSYDPSDPTSRLPLPYFHEAILHPCSKLDGGLSCCGANSSYAPAHLLYRSWFNIPNILLLLTYEVNPRCGDGLTFEISMVRNGDRTIPIYQMEFEKQGKAYRETIRFLLPELIAGDVLAFSAYPRRNHNCDGVFFAKLQLWQEDDAKALSIVEGASVVDTQEHSSEDRKDIDQYDEVEVKEIVDEAEPTAASCEADAMWQAAASSVLLCPESQEHGVFNIETLRLALEYPENCGAYCVFIPVDEISPPTSSLGWALHPPDPSEDNKEGSNPGKSCWTEIGSADGCFAYYQPFKARISSRKDAAGEREKDKNRFLGLDPTQFSLPVAPSAEDSPACDLILSPEEHPPNGFCGPQILIIGAMKCGTNMLGKLLQRHPAIGLKTGTPRQHGTGQVGLGGELWEIHHFTHSSIFAGKDPSSLESRKHYASIIAETDGINNFTFDKSPSYLDSQYNPGIAAAAKKLLPNARIVASVCDPVKRFWSQYNHLSRLNLTQNLPDSFDEVAKASLDPSSEVSKQFFEVGQFAPHLLDWIAEYGRDAVLIVTDEDLERDQVAAAKRLLHHVGLPIETYPEIEAPLKAYTNKKAGYSRDEVPKNVAADLYDAYQAVNMWLSEILGGNEDVASWVFNDE